VDAYCETIGSPSQTQRVFAAAMRIVRVKLHAD
jgi:hypothetical protein